MILRTAHPKKEKILISYGSFASGKITGMQIWCSQRISGRGIGSGSKGCCVMEVLQRHLQSLGQSGGSFSHQKLMEYMIPAYYIIASAEASSNLARFDGGEIWIQGRGIRRSSRHVQAFPFRGLSEQR